MQKQMVHRSSPISARKEIELINNYFLIFQGWRPGFARYSKHPSRVRRRQRAMATSGRGYPHNIRAAQPRVISTLFYRPLTSINNQDLVGITYAFKAFSAVEYE